MPTGDVHQLCLPNCSMRGADRLRSIKDGSKHRWSESTRVAQSLVCLLLLLVVLRVLGQGLLVGVAGAALVHWPVIEGRWFFDGGRIRFDRCWQEHAIRPVDRRGCLAGDHSDAAACRRSDLITWYVTSACEAKRKERICVAQFRD